MDITIGNTGKLGTSGIVFSGPHDHVFKGMIFTEFLELLGVLLGR